jgi:DNA-binding transcriptional MerR regulator
MIAAVAHLREAGAIGPDGGEPEHDLTVDELARAVGMSVRNVRSHQARGLLPAPEVRGRVGYYGPEHVARLRLIQELQGEGMKLDGIRRLLRASEGRGEGLLAVKHAAGAQREVEASEVVSAADLAERLGVADRGGRLIRRAVKLGVLVPVGEGLYEVPSPSLLAVAEDLVQQGISVHAALELVEDVRRHSRAVSQRFVKLFIDEVWKPFVDAGMPDEQWAEIAAAMERSRPLGEKAMLAVFRQTLGDEVESAFAEIARRLSEGKR